MLTRQSKSTITPFELNINNSIQFICRNGAEWRMTLLGTSAEIISHDYAAYNNSDCGHGTGDISAYAFSCLVAVNGKEYTLRREVGSQQSFYEPWQIDGVNLWFDAASCAFASSGGFMVEKDWGMGLICKPSQAARFVIHEADLPICPEPMYPWYPNESGLLDIRNCYCGEDCWMGPYGGKAAHCGLDCEIPRT